MRPEFVVFARRVVLWTLTWLALGLAVTWLFWDPRQATSVIAGAALGLINFLLLARGVFGAVARVAGDPAAKATVSLFPGLRWLGAALATATFLWYTAGRPEGMAAGLALALIGLVCAGLQTGDMVEESPAEHAQDPTDR